MGIRNISINRSELANYYIAKDYKNRAVLL